MHFLFVFYADSIRILCGSIFRKDVFFFFNSNKFFCTIGSVNVTWWILEIMPGSSTTPTPLEEEDRR